MRLSILHKKNNSNQGIKSALIFALFMFASSVFAQSSDATLSDLKVNNATVSGFAAGTTAYSVYLEGGLTEVTIAATANNENANVVGTGAVTISAARNSATVTVTAEDGVTVKSYVLSLYKPKLVASGTSLAMLDDLLWVPADKKPRVTSSTINWWSAGEYIEYYIYSATAQDMVLAVLAANAADGLSQLNVSTLAPGDTWAINTDNTKAIPYNGTADWSVAAASNVYYTLSLAANTPVILRMHCVSNANGNSLANVYGFTFSASSLSNDANLSELKVNGSSIADFNPAVSNYNVVLGLDNSVSLTATANDSKAQGVTGTGNIALTEGKTTATVTVTSESGITKDYFVNFYTAIKYQNEKTIRLATDAYVNSGASATDVRINYFTTGEYVEYYVYSETAVDATVVINAANGNADGVVSELNVSAYALGDTWALNPANTKVIPGGQADDWATASDNQFTVHLNAYELSLLRVYVVSSGSSNVANIYGISFNNGGTTATEKIKPESFMVYGANGNLTVDCDQAFVGGVVELYDISGKIISRNAICSTTNTYQLENKGLCFVKLISSDNQVYTAKCILK